MAARRIETWVWVLVYAGMILVGLGLSVQRGDTTLGWCIVALGGTLVLSGAVLVWVRSRIKDEA